MTNLDTILKRKDITLPTKVRLFKAMVFPVVMYGCARGHLRLLVWVWAHWVLSTCAEMKTRASGSSPPRAGVPSFLQPPWQSLSQQRTLALPPGHRGLREKLLRGFHRPAALAQGPGRAGWLRELGHLERA